MKVTDATGHTTRIAVRGTALCYLLSDHPSQTLGRGHSELRYKPGGRRATAMAARSFIPQSPFAGRSGSSPGRSTKASSDCTSSTPVCSDRHVAEGDSSDEGAGLWRFGITSKDSDAWKKSDIEAI
jgi:hypothetical protein